MRALTAKLSLAALPFVVMVAISYHVDPAHLFGYGPEAQVAALLADGHAVISPRAFEPRLVQREYVRHLRQAPDVVAFGSSRAMQIRSAAFPGQRFVNTGVFGASIEDLVAMAGLYDGAGMMPREVVLDLDPWVLNKQSGLTAWTALAAEYGYMARKLGFRVRGLTRFVRPTFDKYAQLGSPAYFQLSLPLFFKPVQADPVVISDGVPGEVAILLADASRVEARVNRELTPAGVAQLARKNIAAAYYVSGFRELDPLAQEQFERLVGYFVSAGVRVTLLLVPYHPVMFEAFKNNPAYRAIAMQEDYFRAFAKESGVPLLGSYDPARVGCSDAEFFDGWHPRESCVNRVLASTPKP